MQCPKDRYGYLLAYSGCATEAGGDSDEPMWYNLYYIPYKWLAVKAPWSMSYSSDRMELQEVGHDTPLFDLPACPKSMKRWNSACSVKWFLLLLPENHLQLPIFINSVLSRKGNIVDCWAIRNVHLYWKNWFDFQRESSFHLLGQYSASVTIKGM